MSNRELKSLISSQENLPAVQTRLRNGKVAASAMSDEEMNSVDSQELELQQKLSMAHEELESVRKEADRQIQEARENVEEAMQEACEAKQETGVSKTSD